MGRRPAPRRCLRARAPSRRKKLRRRHTQQTWAAHWKLRTAGHGARRRSACALRRRASRASSRPSARRRGWPTRRRRWSAAPRPPRRPRRERAAARPRRRRRASAPGGWVRPYGTDRPRAAGPCRRRPGPRAPSRRATPCPSARPAGGARTDARRCSPASARAGRSARTRPRPAASSPRAEVHVGQHRARVDVARLAAHRAREGLDRARTVARLVAAERAELAARVPRALGVAEAGEAIDHARVRGVERLPFPSCRAHGDQGVERPVVRRVVVQRAVEKAEPTLLVPNPAKRDVGRSEAEE